MKVVCFSPQKQKVMFPVLCKGVVHVPVVVFVFFFVCFMENLGFQKGCLVLSKSVVCVCVCILMLCFLIPCMSLVEGL